MSDNESNDEKRNFKEIMEMVKAKRAKKLEELKRVKEHDKVVFEKIVYPIQQVAFLTKDNADNSISNIIYTYSHLNSVKLREVYGKVASLYKNAEQFKNLIYYHYYFRLNNPLKYHEQFFNQLSPELQETISANGIVDDLLDLERKVYGVVGQPNRPLTYTSLFNLSQQGQVEEKDFPRYLPSIREEFIQSLNDEFIYVRGQTHPPPVGSKVNKVEDEDKFEAKFQDHVNDIIKTIRIRKNRKLLTEHLVLKLLKDYKSTKKSYEFFLENLNKEYANLYEFVLIMGKLSKEGEKVERPVKPNTLTVEQFLVRMYILNPNIKTDQLLKEAKTALPKSVLKLDKKITAMWYSMGEDEVLKNIDFVIDDYISKNKIVTEQKLFSFLSEKLKKPESVEKLKAIIKIKLKTGEKEEEGDDEKEWEEGDEEKEEEEGNEEKEEEEGDEEKEWEEGDDEKEVEEVEEVEEDDNVFENVEEDEGVEEPEQFKRKKQINVQDSQIYEVKIKGLLKTIKIENEKIKIRRKEKNIITQDKPYRNMSQLDNDYQIGMWVPNYKQTWIRPVNEGSEYILRSITLEHKKKTWYRPTKLWFILQCNSLSHKRILNKKNDLVCFYYDMNNVEQQVEFKVLYEHKNDKFTELNADIFKAEELWKKSRTKPRELVDYYKNKSFDSEDYGVRKIAVNNLGNVLSASSKNMMISEDSPSTTAVEIEQRIFLDNKGGTLDQYFTDVSKIIVFLDPTRLGNYALKFRYDVHSSKIKPSSINGKLSREFLLPEIFETDIPGKYEISQVIDRTVSEQRTSMFYELISSVYNLNISIAFKELEINNVVSCTNETYGIYDDNELLHYVDDGKLYCFSVYEMSGKIKNNDLVNQYTKKPFRDQFVNYAASITGISVTHKEEAEEEGKGLKFDLIKEIDDALDEIEKICICGQTINIENSIKTMLNKPNGHFKEKMFCSVNCMDKYDFREE